MTEAQMRALWATAFRNLAVAISEGLCALPTDVHFWTQYVEPGELLMLADTAYTQPLKIALAGRWATIKVPTGEILGLPIQWNIQAKISEEHGDDERAAYQAHNETCAGAADAQQIVDGVL